MNTKTETIKTPKHDYKIGDILHGSWGYDQTNCEYWQVVEVKPASVRIKPLRKRKVAGSEGFMCEMLLPIPNEFVEDDYRLKAGTWPNERKVDSLLKRVNKWGLIKLYDFCYLSKWDGEANYNSWYA